MLRTKIIPLTLAFATLAPGAAVAAENPTADAAMRKGIRDFVRLETDGAGKASKLAITCKPVKKVGQTRPCTGTSTSRWTARPPPSPRARRHDQGVTGRS